MTAPTPEQKLTACDRFGHAWYVGRFGGVTCGRCGEHSSYFCMVNGKPVVDHDHEAVDA